MKEKPEAGGSSQPFTGEGKDTKMEKKSENQYCNGSVLRACFILDLFTPAKNEWTLKEIAKQCKSSSTTVLPLLKALESAEFLERDSQTKAYRLGMKFVEKSQIKLNSLDIIGMSVAPLKRISEQFVVNTHLAMLDRGEMVYLLRFAATLHSLVPAHVGKHVPVYCSALGKALLAYLQPDEAERLIETQTFRQYTPKTIKTADELRAALEGVRERGYATDDEEHQIGNYCISVPIFSAMGTVCASISASMVKTEEQLSKIPALTDAMLRCGAEISASMGYRKERQRQTNEER